MLSKLITAFVYLVVGLAAGYIIWGARVGSLTQSINQLVLEEGTLRGRLAALSSDEDKAVLASALGDLADQLRAHSAHISRQAEAIDRMSDVNGAQLTNELRACSDREAGLEQDLETCLFEKAVLARQVVESTPPVASPQSGNSTYEKIVTYPSLGAAGVPGAPGYPDTPDVPIVSKSPD